ncbi:MAG TPA: cellulase family glycosylhydrolase [Candidatus Saccharimonadales bacterium]|nr:cellulase family glycosylhydrolase [Candidatus Saccharimonadales bacterium]
MPNCIVQSAVALYLALPTAFCTIGTPPPRTGELLATAPATSQEAKGFSLGTTLFWKSNEEIDLKLNRAKILANSVRIDMDWAVIQPTETGAWEWRETDRIVNAATRRGLGVVAMVGFAPKWARDAACVNEYGCAPADPAKFANFAGQVAARYKTTVKKFEIWNEPNTRSFFAPQPNVTKYAAMLSQAGAAIKQASPDAKVGSGGLAPAYGENAPVNFVSQLYQAGATNFDAVGLHPYSPPALPSQHAKWSAFTQIEGDPSIPDMQTVLGVMKANGKGDNEIWLTEYGAATHGTGIKATLEDQHFKDYDSVPDSYVDEALHAKMIDEFMHYKFREAKVTVRMMYGFYDIKSKEQSSHPEDFFGLYRKDGVPKQAIIPFLKR